MPDGSEMGKEADLEAHRTGVTQFERIDEIDRRITEDAGSGSTSTTVKVVAVSSGQRIEGTFLYERKWKIIDDRWQVTRGSVTVLP